MSDKAVVDKEMTEGEAKAWEEMITNECLYADPSEKRVGVSGASVRTETKDGDISAAPSEAKSTATENLRATYRKIKLRMRASRRRLLLSGRP